MGMPVDKFTDEAYKELSSGKDFIVIGSLGPPGAIPDSYWRRIASDRNAAFTNMCRSMRGEKWDPLE